MLLPRLFKPLTMAIGCPAALRSAHWLTVGVMLHACDVPTDPSSSRADGADPNLVEEVVSEDANQRTFPALDESKVSGSPVALLDAATETGNVLVADKQCIAPWGRLFECMDSHTAADGNLFAQIYACNGTTSQQFSLLADGRIQLVYLDKAHVEPLCLTGAGDGNVTLTTCAADEGQLWGAGGHLLQHKQSGLCIARHDGSKAKTPLALVACRRDDEAQIWAIGDLAVIGQQSLSQNQPFPQAPTLTAAPRKLQGFAAQANSPNTNWPTSVALRHGVNHCVKIQTTNNLCAASLYRCESNPQLLFKPDGHIESASMQFGTLPACLAAAATAGAVSGNVVAEPCTTDARQNWLTTGHNLKHAMSGLCLAYDETNYQSGAVSLKACNDQEVRQAWAYGDVTSLRALAREAQVGLNLAQLCATQVTVVLPAALDVETRWLRTYFGGSASSMAAAAQKAYAEDCTAVYAKAEDVVCQAPITMTFAKLEVDSGVAAWASPFTYPVVYWKINPSAWSFRAQTDKLPNHVMHHELAHLLDQRFLYNSAGVSHRTFLVEGYADWVANLSGNPYYPRAKGGSYDNGYTAAEFFLLWLDASYTSNKIGQRFADRIRAALPAPATDPNWFEPWVNKQTSRSLDQLWTAYQNSF